MKSGTSIYLNLVRFAAAAVVFIGHSSGQLFTGGLFWQTGAFTQTAVIVFFVLSGYVIAHVMSTRETTLLAYASSRFGRIYSVVLPALLLTAVCDYVGLQKDPGFYYNEPWGFPADHLIWRYVATLFLVNRWWAFGNSLEPGINGLFWSLSFENFYYCAIAILVFSRGTFRLMALLVVALLAGPPILALAPLWLLGYFTYHLSKRWSASSVLGLCLLIGGAGVLMLSPLLRQQQFHIHIPSIHRAEILADYSDAIAFAVHLIGFHAVADRAERMLHPIVRPLSWLGSLTFALYLFHRPLIQVLAVYPLGEPSSWQQRIWVLGGTFLVVATVGSMCERQKGVYRRAFLAGIRQVERLRRTRNRRPVILPGEN